MHISGSITRESISEVVAFNTRISMVPMDVEIKKDKVRFGFRVRKTRPTVVLPMFSTGEKTSEDVSFIIQTITNKPRSRQNGSCEDALSKVLGLEFRKRCALIDGIIIPFDQEAATLLLNLKLPMLKDRHYIVV